MSTSWILPPTATFPAVSDTGDPDGNGTTTKSANYFFGFLITFVVLLVVSVGCGVGFRRRLDRRRNDIRTWGVVRSGVGRNAQNEPVFWESWMKESEKGTAVVGNWGNIKPISAAFIRPITPITESSSSASSRPSTPDSATTTTTTELAPTPNLPPVPLDPSITSWLPSFRHPPPPPLVSLPVTPPLQPSVPLEIPEAVEVSVMIAMPRPHNDPEKDDGLPEYQFGVARVSWDEGELWV